ncbi:hypothetical protein [Spirosoma endbachense]|uniref:Uncharacterized protein n=1 Tax=Spirosoma endbachense TaxID=2666025 RepID=A0A6P1W4J7_9BACT|nr:hypothetical protein [Spirosoma endbachense]QHV99252.1 hypothetical protein GJR95_31435 [Spirosoma endbachense]
MNVESHNETIVCPKCELIQIATVEHTVPWHSYVHTCSACQYIITESEWQRVQDTVAYYEELKRGVMGVLGETPL